MQYRLRCNIFNSFENALIFMNIYKGRLVKISALFYKKNLREIFDTIQASPHCHGQKYLVLYYKRVFALILRNIVPQY
jgi:pyruvoyl-dependent arginine decarboxylase (PvlArgDC)